jgi:hypothetical protein
MTDYVKSTAFTSKDTLPSGNALKIVKGAELDTEFNNLAISSATKADLLSPVFTGTPTAPTATAGTNTTQLATTAFVSSVSSDVALKAPLASPTFTGVPAVPTASVNTNTTQIASTAFVLAQAALATPLANGTAAVGTATKFAREDHVHPNSGFGVGQVWADKQSVRALSTTYTNSTGKPIEVSVGGYSGGSGGGYMSCTINGVAVPFVSWYSAGGSYPFIGTIIVPVGATYSVSFVTTAGTPTYNFWYELS